MKKYLLAVVLGISIFSVGCKEETTSNMAEIANLRDTVLHSFTEVTGVVIEVKEEHQLNVALIGPKLLSKTDADKQALTDHVADMTLNVFHGKEPENGRVVFSTTDVSNMDDAMAGKTFDMHLAEKMKNGR
jgi:hypothetical protein